MKPIILSLFAATAIVAHAQQTQETVIHSFFGPKPTLEKSEYYAGEMLDSPTNMPTVGQMLPEGVVVTRRLIANKGSSEVYAVDLEKDGRVQNWYAFLREDNSKWKIEAVRTLAQVGILYAAKQELLKKARLTDEERWDLENIKLTLSDDQTLKDFLLKNHSVLNQITEAVKNNDIDKANEISHSIYLGKVSHEGQNILILIGGILDNSVGFMYIPDAAPRIEITPTEYIYLEQVKGSWYVYKTT
jgi:hypothetical protein